MRKATANLTAQNGSQAALPDADGKLPACQDKPADYPPTHTGDFGLSEATLRLTNGENLTRAEAAKFLENLISPDAKDAQIADALTALAAKGETVDELAGMAEAMRNRALRLHSRHRNFIDTAGTGSSSAKTFNVSTAAAFVIAGAGLPVAKHGARAATSNCGSADVLEALGVNTAASPQTVERCLNDHGVCFMFAPLFHRATARVAQVRRQLAVRTTFNLLGPLTNPARAPFQLVGVWDAAWVERVASALALLGIEHAWVVHGSDGLDELTIAGETRVASCSARAGVKAFTISPQEFGLERQSLDASRADGPDENAQLIRAILSGANKSELGPARDLVLINAAAALYLAGIAPDPRHAANLARESIESGHAASKLDALIRETNRR
jgi:anthranilate phosphoribosyltransferase